jgi:isoquinoline 1-oxidoreductase beta subunit
MRLRAPIGASFVSNGRTALPRVVADELGADWNRVRIIQALGDPALWVPGETDASRSIKEFFETMREVGAAARLMLTRARAGRWVVPEVGMQSRPARSQMRVWGTSALRLETVRFQEGRLATEAACGLALHWQGFRPLRS